MIQVRRAQLGDAVGIASVHVAAWHSAYAGILPDDFLARLSMPRHAAQYDHSIRAGQAVFVAADGDTVVGFSTVGERRPGGLGDGEIETLYVLDDWRDLGVGRRLLRAGGLWLAQAGCRSAYLWVLRENPSRWFYQRLGGRPAAESSTTVAGVLIPQTAYVWSPIDRLLSAPAQS